MIRVLDGAWLYPTGMLKLQQAIISSVRAIHLLVPCCLSCSGSSVAVFSADRAKVMVSSELLASHHQSHCCESMIHVLLLGQKYSCWEQLRLMYRSIHQACQE